MSSNVITQESISLFGNHLKNEEKSPSTITKYLHDVYLFMVFMNGNPIEKSNAIAYKEFLGEKYKTASANSMIAALNTFFQFMGWDSCRIKQFKLQKCVFCSEEKELNRNDYIKLVETAKRKGNARLNLIIQSICGTGIRVSELKYITVNAAEKGKATVTCKGKTRTVFIVKELRRQLLKYIRDNNISSGCVFVTSSGKSIDRTAVWREMKALCKKAGVSPDKVFPHNLRHLFAKTFYGINKDISKLADILGHSNINTTRIYIISSGREHIKHMENMRLII